MSQGRYRGMSAKNISRVTVETPIGRLEILASREAVLRVEKVCERQTEAAAGELPPPVAFSAAPEENESLAQMCARQIAAYFAGEQKDFTLPLAPEGTEFQRLIWKKLREIPYGQTRTYGQIAAMAGKPAASRAVGMACYANPIMILIPCHRVIGSDGSLTGYAAGLDAKRFLLSLEREHEQSGRS